MKIFSQINDFFVYINAIVFKNNFHQVVPGRFYRSGEMSHKRLKAVVEKYKIKSVIDLRRGAAKIGATGLTEQEFLDSLEVYYFHTPLNTGRRPSYPRIERLAKCFKDIKLPVLVHCTSGTHRSGIASFIWLLEHERVDLATAVKQLSIRYGYSKTEQKIKRMLGEHKNLDTVISDFLKAYKQQPQSFTSWAKKNLSPIETIGEKSRDKSPKSYRNTLQKAG